MKKTFAIFLLIFASLSSGAAQKNDYIWMPGAGKIAEYPFNGVYYPWGGMTMDFSTFPPTTTRRGLILGMFVQSMISDNEGNLVAYTNGCQIMNRQDSIMDNGKYINPGPFHSANQTCTQFYPAYQATIFTTDPAKDSSYYLFHIGMDITDTVPYLAGQRFYSSRIDATANGGLGKVVDKNNILYENGRMAPYVSAVKHANGRDWWVVTSRRFANRYYMTLLDPTGPHYSHQQVIGDSLKRGSQCCGQAGFSPDGSKFFNASHNTGIQLFDFDRCTGTLSNPVFIDSLAVRRYGPNGVAISQDNRFMYVSTSVYVWQFDLTAPDIEASKILLDSIDYIANPYYGSFLDAMLGPDGKIYMVSLDYIQDMSVIHFPEREGAACKVEQHGYKLPALYGNDFIFNLPRFRLGPVDGSACDSLGIDNIPFSKFRWDFEDTLTPLRVSFTEVCDYEPTSWFWSFGDGETGTGRYPIHDYPEPGFYEVCLIASNANGSDTLCRVLPLGVSASQNPQLAASVQVLPNPFGPLLGVSVGTALTRPVLHLYNAWGQQVVQAPLGLGFNEVDTGALGPGMYFWTVEAAVPGATFRHTITSGKAVKVSE